MQFLQKNQITYLIRDTIAVYALNLAATDYLEGFIWHDHGSNRNTRAYLSISKIA